MNSDSYDVMVIINCYRGGRKRAHGEGFRVIYKKVVDFC